MTPATQFGLSAIGQIAITVHDVERAVAFYRDTLGIRFLFQAPNMAFFDCGGVRLMLDKPEKAEFDHPSSIIYFQVGDIQAAYRRIKDAGAKFEDEPHVIAPMPKYDLWMTFFRDTEGNLLALMSEVPRPS